MLAGRTGELGGGGVGGIGAWGCSEERGIIGMGDRGEALKGSAQGQALEIRGSWRGGNVHSVSGGSPFPAISCGI